MTTTCNFEEFEDSDSFLILSKIKESDKSRVYRVLRLCDRRVCIAKYLKGRHPVYDQLQQMPHPFLPEIFSVTYLPGTDETLVLEEMIKGSSIAARTLSDSLFMDAMSELCTVLEFIHSHGVVHRDIKPSNILLTSGGHVHLIDFDAARVMKPGASQDTCRLGTWGYASPEQFGFSQTDARSDIYSFGMTMKALLGNEAEDGPYAGIIRKATKFDPKDRFQSVDELFVALHTKKEVFFSRAFLWSFPPLSKC